MRIVMWSGPRNLSSAMMRSFGNRPATDVVDEPFYSAYLTATGLDHPMREEIIASQPSDWREAARALAAPPPAGRVRYEKHMVQHMLPGMDFDWMEGAQVAFLIRDPREVAASFGAKRAGYLESELGFARQQEIFDLVAARQGHPPPVVDAADVRRDPRRVLSALCAALGLPFDEAMLAWAPGLRPSDGVWAPHWYGSLETSTGFAPPSDAGPPRLDPEVERALRPAMESWRRLSEIALR
ncbi:HAD family hydrolase [Albimonas sp. CAU 1670]|uniref:sulfotransferase-like domain-containing protein n=1 Tax=Albimonas sp. CAU 1670 TaxID=3032599 RepID=UPI0023DA21E2|nr:HAD family hydrolase [Albimonas sp. CAU 1670]MDF2235329.1 HAD family hydrolase [Albimonas sp. CAU 1670]